ncbi:hypothetical protein RRG08_059273, partial [Elysia crispata]
MSDSNWRCGPLTAGRGSDSNWRCGPAHCGRVGLKLEVWSAHCGRVGLV